MAFTLANEQFEEKLTNVIEALVQKLEHEKGKAVDEKGAEFNAFHDVCKEIMDYLSTTMHKLKAWKESTKEKSFMTATQKWTEIVTEFKGKLLKLENETKAIDFQIASLIRTVLKEIDSLEELACSSSMESVVSLATLVAGQEYELVDIRSPSDKNKEDCWVTGSHVLSDGRLIVTDNINESVKLFDANYKLVQELTMMSKPWDISEVNKGEVAVTLPEKGMLQFINVSEIMSFGRVVSAVKFCRGVSYAKGVVVITTTKNNHERAVVLETSGRISRVLKADFRNPQYVAISPDGTMLYVSDCETRAVTGMTLHGAVEVVYKHETLRGPTGLAVHPDGSVFVCDGLSHNVHHITAQCKHIDLLCDHGEVFQPQSVSVNNSENTLCVSDSSNKHMKVFKLTHSDNNT